MKLFDRIFKSLRGKPSTPSTIELFTIPEVFGAYGDGINDDIVAIEEAAKFAAEKHIKLVFPNRTYRISRQWLVGYKFINEIHMTNRNFSSAPSYDAKAYENARFGEHLNIEGSGKSIIFADFDGTDAAIYYGIIGGGNSSNRMIQHNWHEITGLTIVGKNNYIEGKFVDGVSTQQTGLCLPRIPGVIFRNSSFFGMKFGLLTQDVYGSDISNIKSNGCEFGSFLIGHNTNTLTNIVNDNCKTGMYLSGSATSIRNIWCNDCPSGLQIGGATTIADDLGAGNILVNGGYFENDVTGNNVAQIAMGATVEIPDKECTGISLKNISGATGANMFMKLNNVKDVSMENCSIFYEPVTTMFAKTRITVINAVRPLKHTGPGSVLYLN